MFELSVVDNATIGLAIIPSGEVVRDREGTYAKGYNEEYLEILRKLSVDKGISIFVPANKNLTEVKYGFSRSDTPKNRAEMIYEALSSPQITDIFFTGGNGNEDVVFELNKIFTTRGVPQKKQQKIRIYGMSDATKMLDFLGQTGIVNPYIMYGNVEYLIKSGKISTFQKAEIELDLNLDSIGSIVSQEGFIMPCDLAREYGTLSQTKLVKDKVNFLVDEMQFNGDANKTIMILSGLIGEDGKLKPEWNGKIVFCLSANPNAKQEQERFKKWCSAVGILTIDNFPFGHGSGYQREIIPVFSKVRISSEADENTRTSKTKFYISTESSVDRIEFVQLPNFNAQSSEPVSKIKVQPCGGKVLLPNYNLVPDNQGQIQITLEMANLPDSIQDFELVLKELPMVIDVSGIKKIKFDCSPRTVIKDNQARDIFGYILTNYYPKDVEIEINGRSYSLDKDNKIKITQPDHQRCL